MGEIIKILIDIDKQLKRIADNLEPIDLLALEEQVSDDDTDLPF